MKNLLILLGCLLFFGLAPALAQDTITLRQVTMLDDGGLLRYQWVYDTFIHIY